MSRLTRAKTAGRRTAESARCRLAVASNRPSTALRAHQQIGVCAYEVELADGGATCAGSGAAGSTTAVMGADPFEIPPMLDRSGVDR